jgi:SAC3 family protein LENG8/THP3
LSELYEEGLKGSRLEFLAYRIIYTLFTQNRSGVPLQRIFRLTGEINELMATLTYEEKGNEFVAHALEVREALTSRNYHRLFRLYNLAPNMGGYLMDFFVERERSAACCIIFKSYFPFTKTLI